MLRSTLDVLSSSSSFSFELESGAVLGTGRPIIGRTKRRVVHRASFAVASCCFLRLLVSNLEPPHQQASDQADTHR